MSGPAVAHSTPVALSNTPQYFNFWNEKPIKPREWGVDMHAKTDWRHRGDYGAGKISHKRRKSSSQGDGSLGDSTNGHRNGWGDGLHGYDGDGGDGRGGRDGHGGRDGTGDGDSKTGDTV